MFKYIATLVQDNGHKLLQVNGVGDYVHILAGIRPDQSMATLMQEVKSNSTKWINQQGFCRDKFAWQGGYGAFAYAKRDVPYVIRYIQNQEAHHAKERFRDEYWRILREFDIEYKEEYIFTDPE